MVHQRKWYVVTVGTEPGVYSSWCVSHPRSGDAIVSIEAGAKIRDVPKPIYQGFSSEEEAFRVFNGAKERGEVKAYPNVKNDLDESFDINAPLSPLGEEAALLKTPMDLKLEDAKLTGLQTPVYSRVAQLRRTLRNPTDSSPVSSSPATQVTQVNAPLYVDDDVLCSTPVARRSPHFTFDSSSSRAYPSISGTCAQVQLDVSDGSSLFAPPSAEEHISRTPRSVLLHPESPSRSKGVKFRSLSDLGETENLDARIWLPQTPIFNPDKVKRWPKSRSPSPTKRGTPLPSDEAVSDNPEVGTLADTSFVRAGRGRHSRLTPTWSLPILPNRELEDDCSAIGSRPTQARESPHTVNVRAKEIDFSHIQTVPRDGEDGESSIAVHCSAPCAHTSGFIHVPQRGIVPDLDVRSPISKGTLVPMNAAEALFGRPSPQSHSCNA